MSEIEEWRPVVGWDGLYEVSSFGRVRSLDRIGKKRGKGGQEYYPRLRGRVLKASAIGHGYPGVQLFGGDEDWRPRNRRMVAVHILVCEAFHGARPAGMEAAHNDGDKSNARANNLRWATKIENSNDKRKHGTQPAGDRNPAAKLKWEDVELIRASPHEKRQVVADRYGVSASTIQAIINNRRWARP